MAKCHLISLAALMAVLGCAQEPPGQRIVQSTAQLLRIQRIKRLTDEIWIRTPGDSKRVTKEYVEERLSQMRKVVQDQVLEMLNHSERIEDLRESVTALFKEADLWHDSGRPIVYAADLQGLRAIVVGYSWAYGTRGIPSSRVFIDGYRKTGQTYELAAETGESLGDCCALALDRLDSPRLNEAWFLAHGHYPEELMKLPRPTRS